MLIRPFKPDFSQACCDVINASISATQGLTDAARFQAISKNVPSDLCADLQAGYTLVAELYGQIVALGSLTDDGTIRRVYISPDVHGQTVGQSLMQKLEEAAHIRGHQEIHVDAASSSVAFYENLGYAIVGQVTDDAAFETMKMCKSLAEQAGV
ncbi:MAG: GNAT family N-acetyltransferase [Anaerolineae bacterium]|nr:GNAT family N-acetyltransferase [Anaerolineae bacterium]MDQ7036739.1 GNAT family N-acetyltransferase [Anaerolineae bacterium]